MEISSVGSLTTALSQPQNAEAAGLLVLKKAIDIQEQSALQLLQGLPQIANNPPNLGNSVDIKV
ncbi:MAG: YjfB family protein [Azonexus sp.]|jgi:hypothetical protein|nr:YjfB family protein [Azonexus sp.]